MFSEEKSERIREWKRTKAIPMITVLTTSIRRHAANELIPIFSLGCNGMATVYLSVQNG